MNVKIVHKSLTGMLCAMLFLLMLAPLVDMCNGMESSMYSDVKEAKDFDRWYECTKYIEKHPNGEHINEVCDIFYEEMRKEADVKRIYKYGQKYSNLPLGRKLKDLSYEIASIKDDYISWREYIEVADSSDMRDAQQQITRFSSANNWDL